MLDVKEFRKLIDKAGCMEDIRTILHAILSEYEGLEKEYEELEAQKIEAMMPAIDTIIGTKENYEDIQHLKNVIQNLKTQLGIFLDQKKNLEKSLAKLSIEHHINQKQLAYFKEKNLVVTKNFYECESCSYEWSCVRAERQISDCPCCHKKLIYPKERKILTY